MPFPSTIYMNPVVPQGYYFAKVRNVMTERVTGADRPKIWVELELGPMYREHSGRRFCVIIHPSEKAGYIYVNFLNSFRVTGARYEEAIGRWASVELCPAKYEKTHYSAVRFCHQLRVIRRQCLRLEEVERRLGEVTEEGMERVRMGG